LTLTADNLVNVAATFAFDAAEVSGNGDQGRLWWAALLSFCRSLFRISSSG
jgi:hypothetical protein